MEIISVKGVGGNTLTRKIFKISSFINLVNV